MPIQKFHLPVATQAPKKQQGGSEQARLSSSRQCTDRCRLMVVSIQNRAQMDSSRDEASEPTHRFISDCKASGDRRLLPTDRGFVLPIDPAVAFDGRNERGTLEILVTGGSPATSVDARGSGVQGWLGRRNNIAHPGGVPLSRNVPSGCCVQRCVHNASSSRQAAPAV